MTLVKKFMSADTLFLILIHFKYKLSPFTKAPQNHLKVNNYY